MYSIVVLSLVYVVFLAVVSFPVLILVKKKSSDILPPPKPDELTRSELERYEKVELDLEKKLEKKFNE